MIYLSKKNKDTNSRKGFGLIEVLVGVSIVAGSFIGLIVVFNTSVNLSNYGLRSTQAGYIAQEAIEVLRYLRAEGWENISTLDIGQEYYLGFSGGTWQLTQTPSLIDEIFTRKIIVSEVFRDGNFEVAPSGSIDPDTVEITVMVDWQTKGDVVTKEVSTYLTNILE